MFRVFTRKKQSIRLVNAKAALRYDMNWAWFYLGLLLSLMGAMGYQNSLSFNWVAAPAIPGGAILLIQAYRLGLIRL